MYITICKRGRIMTKVFTKEENQKWQRTLLGKMTSACIALRSDKEVLVVKAGYKDHWTLPSGIVDANESPKAAAIRETYEETGLVIVPEKCSLLTVVYTAAFDENDRERFNFVFIADVHKNGLTLTIPNDEIEKAEWVQFDQIAEKSGFKGSYVNIQRLLLSPTSSEPYVEVHN
jgi:8-oxo-dGTP diphosphatase